MKENTLIIVCLVVIFAGIVLLFYFNRIVGPQKIDIDKINENSGVVSISGYVVYKKFSNESETLFLKVKDVTGTVDVVIFRGHISSPENIEIGKQYVIVGKAQKYKEEMEIIANKVYDVVK